MYAPTIRIALCCCFVLAFCRCRSQDSSSTSAREHTEHQTSRLSNDGTLPEGSDIVSKLEQVSIGNSYEQVISILGPPTSQHDMIAKERAITKGRVLYYVTKQHEPDNLNAKSDSYVAIYLDEKGNVKEILKNNID